MGGHPNQEIISLKLIADSRSHTKHCNPQLSVITLSHNAMLSSAPVVNDDCPVLNSYSPLLSVELTSHESTYKPFTQKINCEGNYTDSVLLPDMGSTEEDPEW